MIYNVPSMPEAAFYFSDQPFANNHAAAKNSFGSGDFIYGRMELKGKTLKEAFHLENIKNGPYYLNYYVVSFKNDKLLGSCNGIWHILSVKENEINNTWLNFDVLPDPAKASSLIGRVGENNMGIFEGNPPPMPLHQIINQQSFPQNDDYTIYVQFNLPGFDGWGNRLPDEKWPLAEGSFTFSFNSNDVAKLREDGTKITENLKRKSSVVQALPGYFNNPVKISDPSVTVAKVTPVIKNYLGSDGYEVLKVAIEPAASMWSIVKNDLGLVSYRYVTGYYKIVYKKDGSCSLGSVRIFQDHIGAGKYGNLYCKFWGDEGDIDCSKLK